MRIYQDAGQILGEVSCPGGLEGSHTAAEADKDGALGVHQALASAIEIAAQRGSRVFVVDEESHWNPDWGDLVGSDV